MNTNIGPDGNLREGWQWKARSRGGAMHASHMRGEDLQRTARPIGARPNYIDRHGAEINTR